MSNDVQFGQYEDFINYRIGSDGTVWSRIVRGSRVSKIGPWWQLTPGITHGYPVVNLCKMGVPTTFQVHRLVAHVFLGPCLPGMQCRHLNGIRHDNRVSNLAWGSQVDNEADKRAHGRITEGSRHGRHILNEEQVMEIKKMLVSGITHKVIAPKFGVAVTTISSIASGHSWRHVK